jgi:hypothetical protein
MNNKIVLLLSACAVLIFTACNKGGKTGLLVPKDAAMVFHIDLSSLSSKLSWDEVKQTGWFAEAQKKADDSLAKIILNDPAASGLDTQGSLAIFLKRSGSKAYFAVEGKLKDAAKFSQVIQQEAKGKIKVEKDGEYSCVSTPEKENATLYFNDKMFVLIADASEMKKRGYNENSFAQKYSYDSLKVIAKEAFNVKGSDLLDSDKRFEELINDKADLHYWINSGNLYGGMLDGVLSMMKFGDLLEGNISTGKINFENGKITMASKQYYNKQLAGIMKKYGNKEVGSDLLSRLPEQNVLSAFTASFNPDVLKDIIKLTGLDGMVNGFLGKEGLTIDDFIKASKGDIAFALTGFSISQTPSSIKLNNGEVINYNKEKTDFKFVFGASVNDKNVFQKIVDVANAKTKKMNPAADTTKRSTVQKIDDKWLVLGSSNDEVASFLGGGKKASYADIFKGHSGGGYVDLQKVISAASANSKDTASKKMADISAAFWKNASMVWDYKGKEGVATGEVNLIDGSTNALKQLNKYFDAMYKATPKKEIVDEEIKIPPPAIDSLK